MVRIVFTGILLSLGLFCGVLFKDTCYTLLSVLLNLILTRKFPIRSEDDQETIPSLPYAWPDGVGDSGKWIDGKRLGEEWRKTYGDVYRIWSGTSTEVVLSKAEHVQAVFYDSHLHHKAHNNDSGYYFGEILGKCVGLLSGNEWRDLRQAMDTTFNHKAIARSTESILKATDRFLNELMSSEECQNGSIDPAENTMYYFFFATAELMYGPLNNKQRSQLREISIIRKKLFDYVLKGGIHRSSISRWLPTRANRELSDFRARWRLWNVEMYETSQNSGTLTPFVKFWELSCRGKIGTEQLLQTLDESLFANLDVTTGAVSWVLLFLAAFSDEQNTLLNEAKESLEKGSGTWSDYIGRNDTFLAATINEAARLRPGLPFSIPQAPPTPRIVGKWVIPAKTMVIVDTYALNVHNPFWGEDRTTFRPSRFLSLDPSQLRYEFFRFGFGPRQCMGKHLADRMLRSLVGSLICKLELKLGFEDEQRMEFSSSMDIWITQTNLKLRCLPRDCKTGD